MCLSCRSYLYMMKFWHRNIFQVSGSFRVESKNHWWIHLTKRQYCRICFGFLFVSLNKLLHKQSSWWWFEMTLLWFGWIENCVNLSSILWHAAITYPCIAYLLLLSKTGWPFVLLSFNSLTPERCNCILELITSLFIYTSWAFPVKLPSG